MRLPSDYCGRFFASASFLILFFALFAGVPVSAQTYTVLHSFGSGTDGANPSGGISALKVGTVTTGFSGATVNGGASGDGTVFRLYQISGVWNYSILANFDGANGLLPYGADGSGNWGTTAAGGAHGEGTIYQISGTTFKQVFNFCDLESCEDGAAPYGGLVGGYGTTSGGGEYGAGTIYSWDGLTSTHTVVHSFAGTSGADGAVPLGRLVTGVSSETLYGTTSAGGTSNLGTVFEFNTSTGVETYLHNFGARPDGTAPRGDLCRAPGAISTLYGATPNGGAYGYGTVYQVTSAGVYSVLYSFTGGADGANPGPIVIEPTGNIIGVALAGGLGQGTVFELTPTGTLGVLHTFCETTGCPDGSAPNGLFGIGGNPYEVIGTTANGGTYNKGTAFLLTE